MKLIAMLVAASAALVTSLSLAAPAPDGARGTQSAPSEAAMSPHSHVQDKLGGAPPSANPAESPSAAKANPRTDRTRHFHPRDR